MPKFAVSGQHYLFNVQSFAQLVLQQGGDAFSYAFRDRSTQAVLDDVASGISEVGVIFKTSQTAKDLSAAIADKGLDFVELKTSVPRIALPSSHPMVNAKSLSLDDMADYPYLYFEQEADAPLYFAEEALADVPRSKCIACTDRASLSELIVALNGYTITSGILVGISDGSALTTIPLQTSVTLHLGYVVKAGAQLSEEAQRFIAILNKNLERYARF